MSWLSTGRRACRRLWPSVALGMGLTSCALVRPSLRVTEPETWFSADTALLIQVPDLERSRRRWEETAACRAWRDPAAAAWRRQQLNPVFDEVARRLGLGGARELLSLATGEAALAVEIAPEASGGESDGPRRPRAVVYAMVRFGSNWLRARQIVRETWGRPASDPKPEGTGDAIALHGDAGPDGSVLCSAWFGEDGLIVATSPDALRDFLTRNLSRGRSFAKAKGEGKRLAESPAWRAMLRHRDSTSDAFVFINGERIYDMLKPASTLALAASGKGSFWSQLEAESRRGVWRLMEPALEWAGLESLDLAAVSVEMRGQGFYHRAVVKGRGADKKEGLLFLTRPSSGPLQTPGWMTRDVGGYWSAQLRSPVEVKRLMLRMAREISPRTEKGLRQFQESMEKSLDLNVDDVLAALGPELSALSRRTDSGAETVFLFQMRDPSVVETSLASLRRAFKARLSRQTYKGYHYEVIQHPSRPRAVYVAQIEGFLMVSGSDQWFKGFIDRRLALAGRKKPVDPKRPAGADSLLPLLEAPFGGPRKGMAVVARSYGDPGPALTRLSRLLPLALPMIRGALMRQGRGDLAEGAPSAIPPLLPFAERTFPSVSRTMQGADPVGGTDLIVTESYTPLGPFCSPLGAAAVVFAGRWFLDN